MDSIYFLSLDLKFMHLTMYTISYYLNFLKDVSILTSYTSLHAPTLNHDHKIDTINFI
jgi:hypothetical protein